jgi:hypothetical protein
MAAMCGHTGRVVAFEPDPYASDDLRPDGWQRFERAIGAAVKAGPKHKIKRNHRVGAPAVKVI